MGINFLLHTTGEALAFICFACLAVSAIRWRAVRRKDTLVAVDLFLFGIILREYAVWRYDAYAWAAESAPHYFSTISRVFMLAGATIFVRRLVRDRHGEWVAPALLLVAFLVALFVL